MVVPVEVSWRRYGADGGPPLPPQPDPQGLVPMHFLNQQLRRGKDGGRVRYANRGGRNAVYHLAMRKLKGKGKADWPEIAALWQDPMVLEAIQKDLMSAWTALNYRASR